MKNASLVIENIGMLVTLRGKDAKRTGDLQKQVEIIENGIIAVEEDRIIYIGQGSLPSDVVVDKDAVIINAEGKTVTPGLIDSHTHLVHGGSREHELAMKLAGKDYLDILAAGGGIHSTMKIVTTP